MKLYTKEELRAELKQGKSLDELLAFREGQECLIFKADAFYPGDKVIYIPDTYLNDIAIYDTDLAEMEIEEYLHYCYTGDYFIEMCGGGLELAERVFWFCDWQNPSTGYEDVLICEDEGACVGCHYYDVCGDDDRTESCDGRKNKDVFEHYRKVLGIVGDSCEKQVRYLVIEYLCQVSKIDPVKMARALMLDGYGIAYDDSTISTAENNLKKILVEMNR